MKRLRKISNQLFIRYSILIVIAILSLTVLFYFLVSSKLVDSASDSAFQITDNLKSKIELIINSMDKAAKQVVFSDSIVDNFLDTSEDLDNFSILRKQRLVSNELYAVIGPNYPTVEQINLINCNNGDFICSGRYPLITIIALSEIQNSNWIKKSLKAKGEIVLIAPRHDYWSGNSGIEIVSVARAFYDPNDTDNIGVVEVPLTYTKLEDIITNSVNSSFGKVLIYDSTGTSIYSPEDITEEQIIEYWNEIIINKEKNISSFSPTFNSNEQELIVYSNLDAYDWTVVLAVKQSTIFAPVNTFRNIVIISSGLIILIALLLSLFYAKKISNPIQNIHSSIKSLSLNQNLIIHMPKSRYNNELEELDSVFTELSAQLNDSISQAITSRSFEIQAYMLALEAKMNPHFLYNTISIIQIMAENKSNSEIEEICQNLSNMLRYSLAKDSVIINISSEILQLKSYLNIMTKRYGNFITYHIDMPKEMNEIIVPKMILQPLAENCFKHGFNTSPPWNIIITGQYNEDHWTITVSDNGIGFTNDYINEFHRRAKSLKITDTVRPDYSKGIGIFNILMRLKLFYGDDYIFEISNNFKGGANLIIGGLVKKKMESTNNV